MKFWALCGTRIIALSIAFSLFVSAVAKAQTPAAPPVQTLTPVQTTFVSRRPVSFLDAPR